MQVIGILAYPTYAPLLGVPPCLRPSPVTANHIAVEDAWLVIRCMNSILVLARFLLTQMFCEMSQAKKRVSVAKHPDRDRHQSVRAISFCLVRTWHPYSDMRISACHPAHNAPLTNARIVFRFPNYGPLTLEGEPASSQRWPKMMSNRRHRQRR